jgi:hypothetical protein
MSCSVPGSGRSPDMRRVGALVGIWTVLAQIALPPLHAWIVGRSLDAPAARASASGGNTPELATRAVPVPVHDAADCPLCQSLLQVRRFLSSPGPAPAVAPQPRSRDAEPAVSVASVILARIASPRAPPPRA